MHTVEQAVTTTEEETMTGREADIYLGITRSRRRALVRRGDLTLLNPEPKTGQPHIFRRSQVEALKSQYDSQAEPEAE